MVHPDQLVPAAAALDGWELPVVVEHTGWPRSNDPDEYELWKTGHGGAGRSPGAT